jgi:hypothetical protein
MLWEEEEEEEEIGKGWRRRPHAWICKLSKEADQDHM